MDLKYDDGKPIFDDWKRTISTFFNSCSNISDVLFCNMIIDRIMA